MGPYTDAPSRATRQDAHLHKLNRRLGWTLASVALCFFIGFVIKVVWLMPH